jgi:hypothetical protein
MKKRKIIHKKMPPKKVTVKTTPHASNILVLFNTSKSDSVETKSDVSSTIGPISSEFTHPDPLIQEYYASLTPNEIIAHTIAKTATNGLGTSYDVSRTHGFLRWQKSRGK